MAFFNLFLLLAMGHFLGDFALQSDRMAQEKCAGTDPTLPWWIWLTAHGAIHGLIVAVLSGLRIWFTVAHRILKAGLSSLFSHMSWISLWPRGVQSARGVASFRVF